SNVFGALAVQVEQLDRLVPDACDLGQRAVEVLGARTPHRVQLKPYASDGSAPFAVVGASLGGRPLYYRRVPYRLELDLALAGMALARNWVSGDPATVKRILAEVRRLAAEPPRDWFDAPLRSVDAGYRDGSEPYDAPGNWLVDLDGGAVHAILERLPAGDALDAACGTGRNAELLRRRGHRVIGVDASPEMLARANARLPDADLRRGELEA